MSWREFQQSGMLWWTNRILHSFGWMIVLNTEEDGTVAEATVERTECFGFPPEIDEDRLKAFRSSALSDYLEKEDSSQ